GVSAAGSFVMAVPVAALSGAQRLDVVNALNLFTLLGRSIVSVVAVALGTGLIGMSLAQAATSAAGAVFALVAAKRVAPALLLRPRLVGFREVVRLLPLSARLTVMAISVQVIFYTDNVIIGVVLGVAAVAPYAVGFQVFDLAMKLTWRPVDVLLPFYAKAHASGSRAAVAAALLASTRVSLCLALAVTLPLVVFAEDLLALWIGGDNVAPWPVLMGFAALVILHAPVHSAAILVSAVTNARWMFWCSIAESVLNVALSLALAHAIGLVGVILGTLLAQTLVSLWAMPFYACRVTGVGARQYLRDAFGRPAIALVLLAAPLAAIARLASHDHVPTVLLGSAAMGLLAVVVFARFGLTADDRAIARAALQTMVPRRRRGGAELAVPGVSAVDGSGTT
ncbi:MAG: lipopolysaccharide biosynthesis protein, partial [Chloroflexota bacterium]